MKGAADKGRSKGCGPGSSVAAIDENGLHGAGFAVDEIEDTMPTRVKTVMKVDQATGLCGGIVVPSRRKPLAVRAPARLGSASQCLSRNPGSMPSTPKHDETLGVDCVTSQPAPKPVARQATERTGVASLGSVARLEDHTYSAIRASVIPIS